MFKQWFTPLLAMEQKTLKQVLLLGTYLFFVIAGSVIGRASADTLFLSNYDLSALPVMYIFVALVSVLTSFVFQKLAVKFKTHKINFMILGFGAAFSILSGVLIQLGITFAYPMAYVGIEAVYILAIISFYNFTANIFDAGQAKKYLGPIGVGASIGGITGGLLTQIVSESLGVVYLQYIFAVFLLICMFFITKIIKVTGDEYNDGSTKSKKNSNKGKVETSNLFQQIPHLKYMVILTITISIALTFVDYQFKFVLGNTLSEKEMGSFMGMFFIITGIINVLIQALGTSKLLSSFGIVLSYILLPAFLLFSSVGLLFLPILFFAVSGKGTEQVLKNTIFNTVNELMFFPIPAKIRARAKGFLDGMVRQGSRGLAGILLTVLASVLSFQYFSLITIFLLIISIVAITRIRKGYLKLLVSNLTNAELSAADIDLTNIDQTSIKLLEKSLNSNSENEVLYAYRMLNKIPNYDMESKITMIIKHHSTKIKLEVLTDLEGSKFVNVLQDVKSCMNDESDLVKAQAIKTYASFAEDCDIEQIKPFLNDKAPKVKAATVYGLLKYHGIDGMFFGIEVFKQLLESPNEIERSEAAEIIGNLEMKTFYTPLIPLLSDANKEVKISAIQSAGKINDMSIIDHITPSLLSNETRKVAIHTLAQYKAVEVIPYIQKIFKEEDRFSKNVSLYMPEVIENIKDNKAGIELLLGQYNKAETKLKMNIAITLARYTGSVENFESVIEIIQSEIKEEEVYSKLLSSLPENQYHDLLHDALTEEKKNGTFRIFKLLAYKYDAQMIDAVYMNLTEGDVRAKRNAIEVLDNLLKEPLRSQISKLIDRMEIKTVNSSHNYEEHLMNVYKRSDEWLKTVITAYLHEYKQQSSSTKMIESIKFNNKLKESIRRVELLKNVSYFENVPGSKLAEISQLMRETTLSKDTIIFKEGDRGSNLVLLAEGEVIVERKGHETRVASVGSYFNELALLDNKSSIETVKSLTTVKILELEYDTFYTIISDHIDITWNVMSVINKRLRNALEHIEESTKELESDSVTLNDLSESLLKNEEYVDKSIIDRVLILFKVDLFKNLKQEDLLVLANMLEEVDYKKGQNIVQYGESGNSFYAIVKGSVKVHKNGTELAVLQRGNYFGEMALIDGGPRTATVTALEACTCVKIDREEFISFCNQRKDVIESMLNVMTNRIRNTHSVISPTAT